MANPIDQREKPVLKELLEASQAAERLISAFFEIGALDGEPFMSIWCQLDRAIHRTQRSLEERAIPITSDLNPPRPAA
jgi:hypothetical protein